MKEELLQILTDYTDGKITEVSLDTVLTADLGLNSVELIDLICIIEEKYDIIIPDRKLQTLVTVKDVSDYLESVVNA